MKPLILILISLIYFVQFMPAQINPRDDKIVYGSLFIGCTPGYKIYIDNNFVGLTNQDEGGLFIKQLEIGLHKIRIKKEGLNDNFIDVTIHENKTTEIDVSELIASENEKYIESKTKNLIKGNGYYVANYGIVEKNTFSPDKEGYLCLRFFDDGFDNNNPTFNVVFTSIDKGDNIKEYLNSELGMKMIRMGISGRGKLSLGNYNNVNIHLEFIREFRDYFGVYVIDGKVSNDGLSFEAKVDTYTRLTRDQSIEGEYGKFQDTKLLHFIYYKTK